MTRDLAVQRPEGVTHYRWTFSGNRVSGWAPIPENETIYAPPAARELQFCTPAPRPPRPPKPIGRFARLRAWLRGLRST